MVTSITASVISEYLKDKHPEWLVEDGSGDFIAVCNISHRNLALYVDTRINVVFYKNNHKSKGVVSTQPFLRLNSLPYTDNMMLDVISEAIYAVSKVTPQ